MFENVPTPFEGQPMRASWASTLARTVNDHSRALESHSSDKIVNKREKTATETLPFSVKYDSTLGTWCVYLPTASVLLDGVTVHLQAVTGSEDWYKVEGAAALASTSGDVYFFAHVKRRVQEPGDGYPHPVISVTAHASASATDASKAGDILTTTIAKATVVASSSSVTRTLSQKFRGPITPYVPSDGDLELYWTVSAVSTSSSYVPHVPETMTAPLCGGHLSDTAVGTGPSVEVHYIIDCSGNSPAPSISSTSNSSSSTVDVLVYRLNNGKVVDDLRQSLARQVYYP